MNINLSHKHNFLLLPDSQLIDFGSVSRHVARLHGKYENNFRSWYYEPNEQHEYVQHVMRSVYDSVEISNEGVGNVSLINESDQVWHGTISLGDQMLEVNFDTGSSDLIINNDSYKPTLKSIETGKSFNISFGDGTIAEGKIYLDSMKIGGLRTNNVSIGLANEIFLEKESGNGIAGLAFPSRSHLHQSPFFDVMIEQKVVKEPIFTFTLRKNESSLYLGGIPQNVQKDPVYIDVDNSRGLWGIHGSINGIPFKGTLDTGTTLIVTPTPIAQKLFKLLKLETYVQDGETYAIYTPSNPPKILIKLGEFTQQLSSETLFFGQNEKGQSILSIMGSDLHNLRNSTTFGDSFLRNVVAIFSRTEKPQIGLISQ